jgi:hypothetical protein
MPMGVLVAIEVLTATPITEDEVDLSLKSFITMPRMNRRWAKSAYQTLGYLTERV